MSVCNAGRFNTEVEAAKVYDLCVLKLWGAKGTKTNFPVRQSFSYI